MSDIDFTYYGLLRAINIVDSGRGFLQRADEIIPLSTAVFIIVSKESTNGLLLNQHGRLG